MKVDLEKLADCLLKLEETYPTRLALALGRNGQFNEGFLYALGYIRKFIVPAIEEEEKISNVLSLQALQAELEELREIVDEMQAEFDELTEEIDEDEEDDDDLDDQLK